jgi:hypothetical protein
MKKLKLIYALLPLLAFTSCKKDSPVKPVTPTKPVIAGVSDSVAYTIDGVTYTAGGVSLSHLSAGTEDANRKLVYPDSTNKYAYSLVGKPDSVMFFEKYTIYSTSANINVLFVQKFFRQQTPLNFPGLNSVLTMFTVGKHPLAEDFEWQNSQNGIAIDAALGVNQGYSSYNAYDDIATVVFPPGFQKNSSFEITSFVHATDGNGGYNLEAKFTAVLFNRKGEQKKLENGYLRLHVDPMYAGNGI